MASEVIAGAAAQRAIIAEGWIPAYSAAAAEVISAAYRDVARSITDGMQPDFAAVESETVALTIGVKTRFVVPMAADGYVIAQRESGLKRVPPLRPIGQALHSKQEIDDDVLLDRVHVGVSTYIETTSKIEGARTALLIQQALQRAALPDEAGRGRTPRQIADDIIAAGVTDSQVRARMLARTTTIWSYNAGAKMSYADAGVREVEWLTAADDLVSEFCAPLHGKIIPISGSFFDAGAIVPGAEGGELKVPAGLPVEHPPLHPNCVASGSLVWAPGIRSAFRSSYVGPIIEIRLANGGVLSVTPYHMLLTSAGWVHATHIREGDNIVDGSGLQRIISGHPDDYKVPSAIEDVVSTLSESPGVTTRCVPVAAEDFHGDARFFDGDIDIVSPDGLLRGYPEPTSLEHVSESAFDSRRLDRLASDGDLSAMLVALSLAADSIMGARCESLAFSGRSPLHPGDHSGAPPTRRHTMLEQQSPDLCARHAIFFREMLHGLKQGAITMQNVSGVGVREYNGHVYDLLSGSSLYIANGIVSSNCRCALVPVL